MGTRAGQGFNVPKPKRRRCPSCGKKGVTQWKVTAYGDLCDCQFCGASWTRAAWTIETTAGVAGAGKTAFNERNNAAGNDRTNPQGEAP